MNPFIKRLIPITVEPSVAEIAQCWCDLDANQQAVFFNYLAMASGGWDRQFCFQLQAIKDSSLLTNDGRAIMRLIGEYSAP